MAAWATACGAPAEAFDAGGDCDDRDPAVGWVHDCRYATISPGPSPAGFGRDIAVADVDGDGVTDVLGLSDWTLRVSIGGRRSWATVRHQVEGLEDLRLGDFNGVGRVDLLTGGCL